MMAERERVHECACAVCVKLFSPFIVTNYNSFWYFDEILKIGSLWFKKQTRPAGKGNFRY